MMGEGEEVRGEPRGSDDCSAGPPRTALMRLMAASTEVGRNTNFYWIENTAKRSVNNRMIEAFLAVL
jgi:hypothetical protein